MTDNTPTQSDYLTVAEVARTLGLSKMTVYRMCDTGQLQHIRTGRTGRLYRISRKSFEQHRRPVDTSIPSVIEGQMDIAI